MKRSIWLVRAPSVCTCWLSIYQNCDQAKIYIEAQILELLPSSGLTELSNMLQGLSGQKLR